MFPALIVAPKKIEPSWPEEQKQAFRALDSAYRTLWLYRQLFSQKTVQAKIQKNRALDLNEISLGKVSRTPPHRPWLIFPIILLFPITAPLLLIYLGATSLASRQADKKFKKVYSKNRRNISIKRQGIERVNSKERQAYLQEQRNAFEDVDGLRTHRFEQEIAQQFAENYASDPEKFNHCAKLRRKDTDYWEEAVTNIIKRDRPSWNTAQVRDTMNALLYGSLTNLNPPDGSHWNAKEARVHSFELLQANGEGPWIPHATAVHKYIGSGSSTKVKRCHSTLTPPIVKAVTKHCPLINPLERTLEQHFELTYQAPSIRMQSKQPINNRSRSKKVKFLKGMQSDLKLLNDLPLCKNENEFSSLMLQVALQIQQLHNGRVAWQDQGRANPTILHLDIKPDNIMFAHIDPKEKVSPTTIIDDIRLQLIDFNLSFPVPARANCITHTHGQPIFQGTPEYIAPEMGWASNMPQGYMIFRAATPHASTKSDVYSLGKTMEELSQSWLSPSASTRENINALIGDMITRFPNQRPTIDTVCERLKRIAKARPRTRSRSRTTYSNR